MATKVASLYGTLRLDDSQFNRALGNAEGGLSALGGRMQRVGAGMTAAVTLPLVGAGVAAIKFGYELDNALANVYSMTQPTQAEMDATRSKILDLAKDSKFSGAELATAFYPVVSAVDDASTHFDILEASMKLAEAGNADLTASTNGVINIMNAYGLSADKAADVSDVLARTVQMGNGNMDQAVNSISGMVGLADDLSIGYDELGAAIAFASKRGDSFSEAGTQMSAVMTAFLKPNQKMADALELMGYESGSAAIEALGLQGATQALSDAVGGSRDAMTQALGTSEALGGALSLTHDDAAAFFDTFNDGTAGATDALREFQMGSPEYAWLQFTSALRDAGAEISTHILPILTGLMGKITPLIQRVSDMNPKWIQMGVIGAGVAAALGPVATTVGSITQLLPILGAAFAVLTGPVGIAIALAGAFAAAYMTNFGGVRDFINGTVRPALLDFFTWLGGVWEIVRPALEALYGWFVETAMPAIHGYVSDTVIPGLQALWNVITDAWALISPTLGKVYGWFVEDALPLVENKIADAKVGLGMLIDNIKGMWSAVATPLASFKNGVVGVFEIIGNKINEIKGFFDDIMQKIRDLKARFDELGNIRFPSVPGFGGARAEGGPVSAGSAYIVGEEGPELFVPGSSGAIVPNDALGGMGAMNVSVQVTVTEGNARQAGADFAAGMEERLRGRG